MPERTVPGRAGPGWSTEKGDAGKAGNVPIPSASTPPSQLQLVELGSSDAGRRSPDVGSALFHLSSSAARESHLAVLCRLRAQIAEVACSHWFPHIAGPMLKIFLPRGACPPLRSLSSPSVQCPSLLHLVGLLWFFSGFEKPFPSAGTSGGRERALGRTEDQPWNVFRGTTTTTCPDKPLLLVSMVDRPVCDPSTSILMAQ